MQSNWYVITGASCSGKTTLLNEIKKRGYTIIAEAAREVIETGFQRGLTIEQIRSDEKAFQYSILEKNIKNEKEADSQTITFFDRALPDAYAYNLFFNVPTHPELEKALKECSYQKIFLLDRLPYFPDEGRIETPEEQDKLHVLLEQTYQKLGFEIIKVPVLPLSERVDFVLHHIAPHIV